MEGEIKERTVQGRKVIGSLGSITKGTNLTMNVKNGMRDGTVLQTLEMDRCTERFYLSNMFHMKTPLE